MTSDAREALRLLRAFVNAMEDAAPPDDEADYTMVGIYDRAKAFLATTPAEPAEPAAGLDVERLDDAPPLSFEALAKTPDIALGLMKAAIIQEEQRRYQARRLTDKQTGAGE
jgi:hypothetical protein